MFLEFEMSGAGRAAPKFPRDYTGQLSWQEKLRLRLFAVIPTSSETFIARCSCGKITEDISHGFPGHNRRLYCTCGRVIYY
jgi:hypothetical protein